MSDDLQSLVREAEVLFSQRDWDDALDKYTKIMTLDPENEEACERLARIYAIRGLISQVLSTYFQLMDILEGKGELELAIEVGRWIMKLQPESDKARMRQIQIYMKKGDRDEVMRQSLSLARLYIELGQGDQSIELLKNAQEMDPNNLDVGIELAEMYIRHGHIQEGADQFRKIANSFLAQGNLEKAADAFKRMKLIQTDDPGLLFTLGNIYVNLGRLNDAEAEFRSILRHDLNHLEALMALGNVCQQKGQFRDAILAFNKILSINPQEIVAKEKLGELYQAQGNVNEAIKNYLSAAHSYQFVEETDKATRLYQRVVSLDPTNPTACRELTNMGAPLVAEAEDDGVAPYHPSMVPVAAAAHEAPPSPMPAQPGMPEIPVSFPTSVPSGQPAEGGGMPAGVVPMDEAGHSFAPLPSGGGSGSSPRSGGLVAKGGGGGGGKSMLPRAGMMSPRGQNAGLIPKSEGGPSSGGAKPRMGGGERPTLARSRTSEVASKPQLIRHRDGEGPAAAEESYLTEAPVEAYVPPPTPPELSEPPETFEAPPFDPSLLMGADSPMAPPPTDFHEPPAPSLLRPSEPSPALEFSAFDDVPAMPAAFAVEPSTPEMPEGFDLAPPPEPAPMPDMLETVADAEPARETFPEPVAESPDEDLTFEPPPIPEPSPATPAPPSGGVRGLRRKGGAEPEPPPAPVPTEAEAADAGGARLFTRGGGGLRRPSRGLRGSRHDVGSRSDVEEEAAAFAEESATPAEMAEAPALEEVPAAPEALAPEPFSPEPEPQPAAVVEEAAVPVAEEAPVDIPGEAAAAEPVAFEEPVAAMPSERATEPVAAEAPAPPPVAVTSSEPSFEAAKLEEYIDTRDLTRAILAFRKNLQEAPADLVMRGRLAETLFESGMVEEASAEYLALAKADTENPAVLHRLVDCFLWSDDPDRAIPLLVHLSYMHRERGEIDDAFQVLQDALTVQRENPQARWELAELFSQAEQQELANWHLRVMADISDEQNDADAAIETYRKLHQISSDPLDQERLARVLEKYGRTDEAVAEYRTLAERFLGTDQPDKARVIYEKITELAPADVDAHEALLDLYAKSGDDERSLERMRILASICRDSGNVDRALSLHEAIVKKAPDDAEARKTLVELYLDKDLVSSAREEARGLLEAWYKENRADEAIALLDRFVAAVPDDVAVREQIIHFYERAERTDEALRARLSLAQVFLARGATDDALKVFQKAMALDDRNAELQYQLGLMHADHLKNDAEAEARFLQVKGLDPTHKEAMKRLVDLQLRLNKPREAIQTLNDLIKAAPENQVIKDQIVAEYKKRVQDHPEDAQSRFTLGVLYKELKLLDHAIEQFQETRKVKELVLASYNMLGQCFAEKKGFNMGDLAIKQFRKGLETKGYRDEEYQELRYNLAELLDNRNEIDEALKLYEDIYSCDVTYRDVAEKMQQLREVKEGGGKITRLPPRAAGQ